MSYDRASAIMTNGYLDSVSSEDGYYLFSEGMEERYNNASNTESASASASASATSIASTPITSDQFGGNSEIDEEEIDTAVTPTGGFPPIFVVTREKKEEIESSKSRELATRTSAVSITDILKKKKQ